MRRVNCLALESLFVLIMFEVIFKFSRTFDGKCEKLLGKFFKVKAFEEIPVEKS